jgi:two-component system sensor histidine kinase KdpD
MAHLIDRRTRRAEADQAPASAAERVMVGLSSLSPNAPALLRKASRLADRLNAPWYAVYIQTPSEDITRTDAATHRVLYKNLELAKQLGGTPMEFKGKDVVSTILAFAREYGIKVIVVGKSQRPWYRRLLNNSILDRLAREAEGVDVMVVDV